MIKSSEYIKLKNILKNRPKLHELKNNLKDWGISNELATYIFKQSKGKKTLEIGSGLSTLVFLLSSEHHTCINPRKSDKDNLFVEIEKQNLNKEKLNFIQSKSEKTCHTLGETYDVILIDGSHTFPWPILDWYYTGVLLRKNSIMILDDIDWWPVAILDLYMKKSNLWSFKFGNNRFSCFEALEQGDNLISHRWEDQADLNYIFQSFSLKNL